jgi:hypothetical protein
VPLAKFDLSSRAYTTSVPQTTPPTDPPSLNPGQALQSSTRIRWIVNRDMAALASFVAEDYMAPGSNPPVSAFPEKW